MSTIGEKVSVIAGVVTIIGGVLYLFKKQTPDTTTAQLVEQAPNAAAATQTNGQTISQGPAIQIPWQNNVPNYPSLNLSLGIPYNDPSALVGTTPATAPAYTLYNLPANGLDMLTTLPQVAISAITTAFTNIGTLPEDFLSALSGIWNKIPAPSPSKPKSGGCGCSGSAPGSATPCGGAKNNCGSQQTYGGPSQQVNSFPMTYLSASSANTASGYNKFAGQDPRLQTYADALNYE